MGTSRPDAEGLQRRSRALGDPTRYRIYQWIAAAETSVTVAALTEVFDLNHNTVRQHLRKLCDAELLEEIVDAPRGPGRPRLLYRLTAEAATDWNHDGPYERLSLLLLEIATSEDSPREVGRRAGRAVPLHDAEADPVAALGRVMTAQGFAPDIDQDETRAEVTLRRCPFAAAAKADPALICDLHRGLTEGMISRTTGVGDPQLIARDPYSGECALHLHLDHAE